jgi:hypothetical protein
MHVQRMEFVVSEPIGILRSRTSLSNKPKSGANAPGGKNSDLISEETEPGATGMRRRDLKLRIFTLQEENQTLRG